MPTYKLKCHCETKQITTKNKLSGENWMIDDNGRLVRRWKCDNCYGSVRATKV